MSETSKKEKEFLDISPVLGKVRNRIYRVGVELEGGWKKLPSGVLLVHDGSVTISPSPLEAHAGVKIHVGELPSTPMEVGKVSEFIEQFYPSHVNNSCGLHVHMSFKNALHYQKLMIPEYPKTILEFMKRWALKEREVSPAHPIWERLKGKNTYCKDEFFADAQACSTTKGHSRGVPGSRYSVINYCHGLHGTLECRLLPMMENAPLAIKAVQEVLDITNACLVAGAEREEKLKGDFIIDGGSDVSETNTRVNIPPPGVESEDESIY